MTRISLGLMINAGMLLASSRRLIFGRPVIALGIAWKSLSVVKWDLMKPTRWPRVSLVTRTGMFLWMSSPHISGGSLLSLRCSARVRHCLRSLVRVGDWRVSRLARLICCRIILTASNPERLFICRSLVIHLQSYHLCVQVEWGEVSLVRLGPLWWHWPIGYVSLFLKRSADAMAQLPKYLV